MYRNSKKREEARRLNKQFELDPGRVYFNLKKIIETQEGVDKPKYDHRLQDEGQDERLFNDVKEASRFWKSLWETKGIGNTLALWLDEIRSAIRDSVPEMMEEDFELIVDQAVRVISRKRNWSAPGPDRLVNFWWKRASAVPEGVYQILPSDSEWRSRDTTMVH